MKELLQKKITKIGIAVIILIVAIGIISINARSAQRQREYDGHVEAAEKYLTELDYEQAIAEYTLALEIEPNNEEVLNALEQTYLDYAQSLADAGEYDKAVSVLEEGYAQIGRESLREKIDDVRSQQAQREAEEAEARRLEEEAAAAAKKEAAEKMISEAVQLNGLWQNYWNGFTFFSDTQVRELCEPLVDIFESYLETSSGTWQEDDLSEWYYRQCLWELSNCYYLLGEYDKCMEKRWQYYEVCDFFEDDKYKHERVYHTPVEYLNEDYTDEGMLNNTYLHDEYGRLLNRTSYIIYGDYAGSINTVQEYEYGEDGKCVKETRVAYGHSTTFPYSIVGEGVTMYEYDASGRIIKETENWTEPRLTSYVGGTTTESITEYEYYEWGCTEYFHRKWIFDDGRIREDGCYIDIKVDEYGYAEYGSAYNDYDYEYSE